MAKMKMGAPRYRNLMEHWKNVEVTSIFWSEGEQIEVGSYNCKSITPYVESGEMGWALWFEVEFDDKTDTSRFNASHLEGVTTRALED